MRNIKAIILVCGFIGFTTTTCKKNSNDNDSCQGSNVTIESLNDVSGIIGFDNSNNQYFINKWIEGTIDGMYTLYPCALGDEYKKVNLQVIFSGELYITDDLPKPRLGGQEMFHIKIRNVAMVPIR